MAHVVAAQYVWFDRLTQQQQRFPVWPKFTLAECEAEATKLAALWTEYLNELTDDQLAVPVTYKNTIGEAWSSRVDDVLTHVLMHSSYHRGQIASDTRDAGLTPRTTDFIHAIRQGFVK